MTVPNACPENLGSAADWGYVTTGRMIAGCGDTRPPGRSSSTGGDGFVVLRDVLDPALGIPGVRAPGWLEEPFAPAQVDAYAALRDKTAIPLAAGEHLYDRPDVPRQRCPSQRAGPSLPRRPGSGIELNDDVITTRQPWTAA